VTRQEAGPDLIARARHDRAAFAALYDLYVARVYAFCAVHSANREDAANTAINRARRPAAVPLSSVGMAGDSDGDAGATAEVEDTRADGWVEEWERADWIEEHLAALSADGQQVVRLRFYDDLSFDDVAARMDRSEGAVKQLLRRTLTALRGRIQEEEGRHDVDG